MKPSDIANARLVGQQIASSKFAKAKDIVAYMGAMQAQDYSMAKLAIGLRLPGSTDKNIENELDKGDIIRAHVLRPTWHIIPTEDIYWMLALSCDRIKSVMKLMDRYLQHTDKLLNKSNSIIEKCLEGNKHLTREDLATGLEKAKIATDGYRLSHLLLRAEMDGIICSGEMQDTKRTYALLEERVPKKKILSKEESLALLAKKYFSSHGPATVKDFTWWSGQSFKDAKLGLESVKSGLVAEKINTEVYWLAGSLQDRKIKTTGVYLLPAFDEFLISYKDRTASLSTEHHKKIITRNGIFNPSIIVNGKVIGLWKRNFQKSTIVMETVFFEPLNKTVIAHVNKQAKLIGQFFALKAIVSQQTFA